MDGIEVSNVKRFDLLKHCFSETIEVESIKPSLKNRPGCEITKFFVRLNDSNAIVDQHNAKKLKQLVTNLYNVNQSDPMFISQIDLTIDMRGFFYVITENRKAFLK